MSNLKEKYKQTPIKQEKGTEVVPFSCLNAMLKKV
jgi:hypothetical protein